MAKLSKEAAKRHKQALDLVYSDKSLNRPGFRGGRFV